MSIRGLAQLQGLLLQSEYWKEIEWLSGVRHDRATSLAAPSQSVLDGCVLRSISSLCQEEYQKVSSVKLRDLTLQRSLPRCLTLSNVSISFGRISVRGLILV